MKNAAALLEEYSMKRVISFFLCVLMTAALLACRLPAFEAASCAVYLHGAAADRAAALCGEYGMLPHDILPQLGRMFAENQR